jgi:phosphopantothenoylcysteine synthetase/decarboxylase
MTCGTGDSLCHVSHGHIPYRHKFGKQLIERHAPATVNTINKWAAGICDTLALGILVEAIWEKLPIVSLPFTNWAQAAHPAFEQNIAKLQSWGVQVLYGPDVYPLHAPGTGGQHLDAFPGIWPCRQ